jgi:hypothetical protein
MLMQQTDNPSVGNHWTQQNPATVKVTYAAKTPCFDCLAKSACMCFSCLIPHQPEEKEVKLLLWGLDTFNVKQGSSITFDCPPGRQKLEAGFGETLGFLKRAVGLSEKMNTFASIPFTAEAGKITHFHLRWKASGMCCCVEYNCDLEEQ